MIAQTLKQDNFIPYIQYIRKTIPLRLETVLPRCTVVVTTHSSEYAVFLKTLRKHNLLDERYSMIEMHHAKRRMTYVTPLNLLVVQMENIEKLKYLNITSDKILLSGTARCFDVKQAPCDTIVIADAVWDKEHDITYECSDSLKTLTQQISAARCRTGGYFSETDLQTILKMQKEKKEDHTLLAFDEDSVAFARICHNYMLEWAVIKAVTNDISIPNTRMCDHAAELAANYIIKVMLIKNFTFL